MEDLRAHAPWRKLVIFVVPRARAPSIMPRWEMDLSPGIWISPLRLRDFVMSMLV